MYQLLKHPNQKTVIEKVLTIRFIEKTTGNIFDIDSDQEEIRTTSETIVALAEEALTANLGNTILFRYINTSNDREFPCKHHQTNRKCYKNSLSGSFYQKHQNSSNNT